MSRELNRHECQELQGRLEALRDVGEDYLIVSVGVRGPNMDCEGGNAVATVRMGNDEATSEAAWLYTAITLARSKIIRERAAKVEAAKQAKDKKL
jgi:hypothetical protein